MDYKVKETLDLLLKNGLTNLQKYLTDWKLHDHETPGHPGELETYNSVRQHYWWPGL